MWKRSAFSPGFWPIFAPCKTGIHYVHVKKYRRQWIEDRLLELSATFSIDIAAYAIMHNHYHVVLHIDKDQVSNWSIREVCEHWYELFSGNDLSSRYLSGKTLSPTEEQQLPLKVDCWRDRLIDISWFMR